MPVPTIGINDVLIKVLRTGICGTDLHIYKWDAWAQKTIPVPMVVGHEFVGEIVEVGSNVKDFHPGDIVSGEGHVVCGRCRNCLAGRRHLCKDTQGVGVNRPGAFAEYLALPMTNVWVHDPAIDRDVAAIFDPFGNAVHTALSFRRAGRGRADYRRRPDRHHGRGGRPACRGAPRRRHRRQSLTAWSWPGRWAPPWPSTSRTETVAEAAEEARHEGRLRRRPGDVRQPGRPSATCWPTCATAARSPCSASPRRRWPSTGTSVIFNMLTIKGIYGREMYETWYKMTVMLQSGLDISPVITHRFPFTEFQKGFDVMRAGRVRQGGADVERGVKTSWDKNPIRPLTNLLSRGSRGTYPAGRGRNMHRPAHHLTFLDQLLDFPDLGADEQHVRHIDFLIRVGPVNDQIAGAEPIIQWRNRSFWCLVKVMPVVSYTVSPRPPPCNAYPGRG